MQAKAQPSKHSALAKTLFLDTPGTRISLATSALELRTPAGACDRIPTREVARVVCGAPVALDSSTLVRLNAAGISLVCLHRHHAPAVLAGRGHGDVGRRQAQFTAHNQVGFRPAAASALIRIRLVRQRRSVAHWLAQRPAYRRDLLAVLARQEQAIAHLAHSQPALPRIRGIEGAATAAWFRALALMLPGEAGFSRRRRRPPPDPANACLSLAYTLLNAAAEEAIVATGLDPNLGVLHEISYNRASLACDLIEPLRPAIDAWVLALFASGQLRARHFNSQGNGCQLTREGRGRFYRAWETGAKPWRKQLQRYARWLLRRCQQAAQA